MVGPLAVSACDMPLLATSSDLERTWTSALVILPAGELAAPITARIGSPRIERWRNSRQHRAKVPAVIYMHGCTGFGDTRLLATLARAGFAVIAPDSMARRYRPLQCDPKTRTGGQHLFVYDFRQAEISYALERIRSLDWVDRDGLFLVGVSEGAVATALYRGDEFRARVIAQWTCNGAAAVRGIGAPPGTPILAIVHARDPWYDPKRTAGQRGHCGQFLAAYPESRSIVIESGKTHDVFADPRQVDTVLAFIQRNRGD